MAANIGAELKALPLEDMLSAPLTSVIKAQAMAARTTVDFIQEVGLKPQGEGEDAPLTTVNVDFSYSKPVTDPDGEVRVQDRKLSVPLLSIVPIPFIRVQELTVDFEFRIKDTVTEESSYGRSSDSRQSSERTSNASANVSFKGWGWRGSASASTTKKTSSSFSVSTTSKHTSSSSTDRSARLSVQMKAVQDTIPEGLSRVLTILNDAITSPEPTASGGNRQAAPAAGTGAAN